MTDIVERLRESASQAGYPKHHIYEEAADEIERLRKEVAVREAAAFKMGGEEALLHALHPEFGSIYADDGEATAAFNKGRREGIEACIAIAHERGQSASNDADAEDPADRIEANGRMDMASEIAATLTALLEDGR